MQTFTGEIIHISTIKTGQTKKGDDYKAIEYVVKETSGEYPQSIVFSMFNMAEKMDFVDKFSKYNKIGDVVRVEYTTEANLYNGNYFGKNKHYKVEKLSKKEPIKEQVAYISSNDDTDLPF
jgi:hypothetical protein